MTMIYELFSVQVWILAMLTVLLVALALRIRPVVQEAPIVAVYKSWDAEVVSNHDGDTVTVIIDHEFGILSEQEIRIYGMNSPELDELGGKLARDHLASIIPPGSRVIFTPQRLRNGKMKRSFIRYVGMIEKRNGLNLLDIGSTMVFEGFAGWTDENGKPSDVPPKPLKRVE